MTKQEYLAKRTAMVNEAQGLLDASNPEDANLKMKEIEVLDAQFEESAKMAANLAALDNKVQSHNPINGLENVSQIGQADLSTAVGPALGNASYEEVFAKVLMGRDLTNLEIEEYERMNNTTYVHQAKDQEILVPETVVGNIIGLISARHPFFGEVQKLNIPGKISVKKHTEITEGDAAFVDEGEEGNDEKNKFEEIVLSGFEVVKNVTISFKLEAMSIKEFTAYIQREIATRIGHTLGKGIFTGTGVKQPKGVLVELAGTSQTMETSEGGKVSYTDLTSMRSKIASDFSDGLKYYAKSETIWNQLANVVDQTGRAIFIPVPSAGGVGTIFGVPVVEDDGVPTDEIVLGNPANGIICNTNKPLSIETERHLKKRETLYQGHTIIDWSVTQEKAFAHLTLKAVEEPTPPSGE
ncbi:phage major capsid protein [Brochothrix campestris]|uniref:Phage capsid-like C-terminal domain-containing protein n=1 Tax=Brochothrix campestris FSL F6-1037 TaxID=1265861 RepID=W7D9N4_9LIST|nr:phage major capsid protein [Brochothrix campestris]EUJ41973.1 hypothetical protein BCAMP_01150 [Brochothrix campestris FSL F6-1037]